MAFPIRESCSYTSFFKGAIDLIRYSIIHLNRREENVKCHETRDELALIESSH